MKRDKLKPIECIVEEFETSANPFGGLCDKLAGFDSARVIIHLKEEPAKLSKKLEYGLRAIKDSRFIN